MVTKVYRNADVSQIVLSQLPGQIAAIHKETAKEFITLNGMKDFSVFAFKKFQKPRKYVSVDAIPETAIPMPSSIGIVTASGRNLAAYVAREFVRLFLQMAGARAKTGNYKNSLRLTLNGKMRALSTIMKFQEFNPLKQGEIIEVWSAVEYASTLEAPNYNVDGIFLKITRILLGRYGSSIAIRFTYRSGMKMGLAFKYATPVVMIGARGEFASSITTRRGYQLRRRKRVAAKAELQSVNAKRIQQGLAPYKRLPRKRKAP